MQVGGGATRRASPWPRRSGLPRIRTRAREEEGRTKLRALGTTQLNNTLLRKLRSNITIPLSCARSLQMKRSTASRLCKIWEPTSIPSPQGILARWGWVLNPACGGGAVRSRVDGKSSARRSVRSTEDAGPNSSTLNPLEVFLRGQATTNPLASTRQRPNTQRKATTAAA